eukprot:TCONS_00049481-protein
MVDNLNSQQNVGIDKNKCREWMKIARSVQVCLKQNLIDILHDPEIDGLPKNSKDRDDILNKYRQVNENELKEMIMFGQLDFISKDGQSQIRRLCIPNLVYLINRLTNIDKIDSGKLAGLSSALEIHQDIYNGSITSMGEENFQNLWKRIYDVLIVLGYSEIPVFHYLKEKASLDEIDTEQIEVLDERCRSLKALDNDIEIKQREMSFLM